MKISLLSFVRIVIILFLVIKPLHAEVIYIDCRHGSDVNPGTKEMPLLSFEEAAERINASDQPGPTELIVSHGVYTLSKTIPIENDRSYTASERFTITAEILPDDPRWKPELMPVILSTAIPDEWLTPNTIVEYTGIKPEISHVTIQGLKFLGSSVPEIWYYPIFREGKTLDDLLVTQCVFAMEDYAVTCNVGILSNGHGLVVDHCVFKNFRNPVVFWNAEGGVSRGNAMQYCIVEDAYTSACWVCDTDSDFEFHHNIITEAEYVWMRSSTNTYTYSLSDCIITDYRRYSGCVVGPDFQLGPTGPDIVYDETNVRHDVQVRLEKGCGIDHNIPIDFLHPVKGTPGSELGAGLFKSSSVHREYIETPVMERTIAYKTVEGHPILADVFVPASDDPVPVAMFIHGGGMMFASRKHLWSPLKDALLRAGIGIVAIDFRLATESKVEDILQDTQDALTWLRSEGDDLFGFDTERVALIGGSSGAYQALLTGCNADPKPQAVVTVSGLGDLDLLMTGLNPDMSGMDRDAEVFSAMHDGPVSESDDTKRLALGGYLAENGWLLLELLGFNPMKETDRWDRLCFSRIIPLDFPPTLVIHAENDQNVSIAEAHKIKNTLDGKDIESRLLIVPEGHSKSLIENNPAAVEAIIAFLTTHFK